MQNLFVAVVVLLLAVGVFDLIVGVANDAVNFLSSAVGARAASLRTVMIVASIGVFVGAASSGGMMEIAKRGVFNPELLSFQDVMSIFVAVMLTDIFVLDFFNFMKLPTSTTISIVFELIGASLAVSMLRVLDKGQSLSEWMGYINGDKAIQMILAIFVSVVIAFAAGWLVQLLVRACLTFDYERHMRVGGALFGGLASVAIVHFLITVALEHSPLRHTPFVQGIHEHLFAVLLAVGTLAAAGLFALGTRPGFNTFNAVTLAGTFALAMAFASNDLVNFVGVPIAGYEAFELWSASGQPPDQYMMTVWTGSAGQAAANPGFLLAAGAIMVATLWLSRKARKVIETSLSLCRQEEGTERFVGSPLSRASVRFAGLISSTVQAAMPVSVTDWVEARYAIRRPDARQPADLEAPAFDPVRASTSLAVSATLITLGTAMKLPLSTTYVTFMVMMGSSLADRAWHRETAVYRVSGVLAVIGGWFVTAAAALLLSTLTAYVIGIYGFIGMGLMAAAVAAALYFLNRADSKETGDRLDPELPESWFTMTPQELRPHVRQQVSSLASAYAATARRVTEAALTEDRPTLGAIEARMKRARRSNRDRRGKLLRQLRTNLPPDRVENGKALFGLFVEETALLESLTELHRCAALHVRNLHAPLAQDQQDRLRDFSALITDMANLVGQHGHATSDAEAQFVFIENRIDAAIGELIHPDHQRKLTQKSNELFLSVLLEHRAAAHAMLRLHRIAQRLGRPVGAQSQGGSTTGSRGLETAAV